MNRIEEDVISVLVAASAADSLHQLQKVPLEEAEAILGFEIFKIGLPDAIHDEVNFFVITLIFVVFMLVIFFGVIGAFVFKLKQKKVNKVSSSDEQGKFLGRSCF